MAQRTRLDSAERDFFSLVDEATLANPFGEERARIDRRIAERFALDAGSSPVDTAVREVARRVDALERKGFGSVDRFAGRDREVVKRAFLFDLFHRFSERFDDHIRRQNAAGRDPLPVPFAGEALKLLHRRGFEAGEAERHFAMCFQVRRAYFFIDRGLVGSCGAMRELRRKLWSNVFTGDLNLYDACLWDRMEDFSTLILGETGTGKGTAAMAVGRSGFIPFDARRGVFVESFRRSFVALNLSGFPEALIESELFGHSKGAFTGAVSDYRGVFDNCSPHGAIFLDEIGEVSEPVQIKLLNVLQERRFSPVGSHEARRFRGRVIAATNRRPEDLRGPGGLREDFYYRLCSDLVTVPTLRRRIRENPAELHDLLGHTVERILGRPSPELVRTVEAVIDRGPGKRYPWPGNVRELEQCVRRVILDGSYGGDVHGRGDARREGWAAGVEALTLDARQLLAGYCRRVFREEKTYEGVARRTGLDRRTVKKYIASFEDPAGG